MSSKVVRGGSVAVLVAVAVLAAVAGCSRENEASQSQAVEQPEADLERTISNIRTSLAEKNYGEASMLAKSAQVTFPASPDIHLLAAQAEGYLGNSGNAAAAFQRAIDNGLSEPGVALASSAFASVRTSDAFADLRSKLQPTAARTNYRAASNARESIRAGDVEIVEDSSGGYVRAGDVVLELQ